MTRAGDEMFLVYDVIRSASRVARRARVDG
jgi:hypothetical protein